MPTLLTARNAARTRPMTSQASLALPPPEPTEAELLSEARRMWLALVTSRIDLKSCLATQRAVSSALERVSTA